MKSVVVIGCDMQDKAGGCNENQNAEIGAAKVRESFHHGLVTESRSESSLRRNLICSYASDFDSGRVVILPLNRTLGQSTHHGQLPNMSKGIGH